jgi:hypothetical protein
MARVQLACRDSAPKRKHNAKSDEGRQLQIGAGSVQTQFRRNTETRATQPVAKQDFQAACAIGSRHECMQGSNIPATGMPARFALGKQLPAVIIRIEISLATQRRMQLR